MTKFSQEDGQQNISQNSHFVNTYLRDAWLKGQMSARMRNMKSASKKPQLVDRGRYPAQVLLKVEIDYFRTYMARITGSVGSKAYRSVWAKVNGTLQDITEDGIKSCALFVSTILHGFDLTEFVHTGVPGTIVDLEKWGWKKISRLKPGAIVTWSGIQYADGLHHAHLGFVLNAKEAISMSDKTRTPVRHSITFGPKGSKKYRPVFEIWWHPKLG